MFSPNSQKNPTAGPWYETKNSRASDPAGGLGVAGLPRNASQDARDKPPVSRVNLHLTAFGRGEHPKNFLLQEIDVRWRRRWKHV